MFVAKTAGFIVETALLGQGLVSIGGSRIKECWPDDAPLVWLQKGRIVLGSIGEFLRYKNQTAFWRRLDGMTLDEGINVGADGFLTASGAIIAAVDLGCPIVVSAGLGGIGDIIEERLCFDLPALAKNKITLVATSPKDMLDIPRTIGWLHENGVNTIGVGTVHCDGYVFMGAKTRLSKVLDADEFDLKAGGHNLILNPIPHTERIKDYGYLRKAVKAGKLAEQRGEHYHPAANRRLDELTLGRSSVIQLNALLANVEIARRLAENP